MFLYKGMDYDSIQQKNVHFVVSLQHLINQKAFLPSTITEFKLINLSTATRGRRAVSDLQVILEMSSIRIVLLDYL